jgi:UDP:flavonoid glycosyltransferase YjiC (YdhE family)
MTTFLIVAHGTDGDVLPVIRIGRELSRRGHRTVLLSHARYARRARTAGVRFVALDTLTGDELGQADDGADINNIGERRDLDRVRDYYERHGFRGQFGFECRAMQRLHRDGDTVLVGLSLTMLSVLAAAELLDAPAVCLAASPFSLTVRERAAKEYHHTLGPATDLARGELGLPPVPSWPEWLTSADAHLGTWPEWFDAAGDPAPPGTRRTGFILGDEDGVADEHTGLDPETLDPETVLIAGSSGHTLTSAGFYHAATAAVSTLDRPAVVVTRLRELVPDPLPPGVRWYPRLPFREVMPRVAAVVHHGGIGTIVRALHAGTPQLLLAGGFDRPDNARRLAAAGLAEWLPETDLDPAEVTDRLSTMLARGRVDRPPGITADDSVPAAADALESVPPG